MTSQKYRMLNVQDYVFCLIRSRVEPGIWPATAELFSIGMIRSYGQVTTSIKELIREEA
jgi:hypothetical protein